MIDKIYTVSSNSFIQGTIVLFRSILKNNQWFNGEFIVVNAGLSEVNQLKLKGEFNCFFVDPSKQLNTAIESLISNFPEYLNSKNRFYSLEIFNQFEHNRSLFLDSDILCNGDFSALNSIKSELSAVADPRYYGGFVRNKTSLLPVLKSSVNPQFSAFFTERFFNTGMFLINKLPNSTYNDLIALLSIDQFQNVKTGHTDTVVLNRLLLDKVNWLDLKYNCYSRLVDEIKETPIFIHFLGRKKPWNKQKSEMTIFELDWLKSLEES